MYTDAQKILGVKIDRKLTPPQNVQQLMKKINAGRTDVGSKNPYAAAEHKLGIKFDWKHSRPDDIERLLLNIEKFVPKSRDQPVQKKVENLPVLTKKTKSRKGTGKASRRKKA